MVISLDVSDDWVGFILKDRPSQLISMDVKTIQGAKSHSLKSPIYIISA